MKKISLREFTEIIESDEALRAQVAACPDPETALATVRRLARKLDYELEAPAAVEALSDDELDTVAGGRNPFLMQDERELNPYSWFVTLLLQWREVGRMRGEPMPKFPGVNTTEK